jgi:cell division protein FtsI/penicillin-binding protein 2
MSDDHRLIPAKANRVLNLILLSLLLIFVRVWYLSVVQYDDQLEQARKPQRRSSVEQVERATIRDRFNIPLAINKIEYKAAIYYADIRQIPSTSWKEDEHGERKKVASRSLYIAELAQLLSKELALDPERIEDLIHSKASLFPHVPFFIKDNLSEEQYYRLKLLEKDWLGIYVEKTYKRVYPQGKTGSDIIGYMGAINDKEHLAIAQEIKELKTYLEEREEGGTPLLPKGFNSPIEARERLKELKEKAYTINDIVGKAGIEAAFEEQLRGFYTKKLYEVDRLGTVLRELPGTRKAISGQRVILSISSELQEFAESLLASNEEHGTLPQTPWIKGGAIVAMHPKTGEILALASSPRFDPNDFITKGPSLLQWIENETYISELWDGKKILEKELYAHSEKKFTSTSLPLTWDQFLKMILNKETQAFRLMQTIRTIGDAVRFQELNPAPQEPDTCLVLDLCRLVAQKEDFSNELLSSLQTKPLTDHRHDCQVLARAQTKIRSLIQQRFHEIDFKKWRAEKFKDFLKSKRKEEKENKKYPRPYIEYLDAVEKQLFKTFWETNRFYFLDAYFTREARFKLPDLAPYLKSIYEIECTEKLSLSTLAPSLALQYLKALRSFNELTFPLQRTYRTLRNHKKGQTGKDLASAFYPISGFGYGRSQAYRQSTPAGSIFKLVVAYEALMEHYAQTQELLKSSPFSLIDDYRGNILGYQLNGEPITRHYKGGRLPKSSHSHIGQVDLLGAIEQSSNIYFSLLASDIIKNPSDLTNVARQFGFGKKTGIELPGEFGGNLPQDLSHNKTGLYSFAIGQHSLVVTPLQTAVMLSALANGGDIIKPKIIKAVAGHEPSKQIDLLFSPSHYPFKKELRSIGIHFPLFTEALSNFQQSNVTHASREIAHEVNIPENIRKTLLEGMRRVVTGARGTARPAVLRRFFKDQSAFQNYLNLHTHLVGKTGTAEILYKPTIDAETKAKIENHVWFGGIAFDRPVDASFNAEPELVVVVYLRFGGGGKEAAPLAAQIVHKWREIQSRHHQY